MLKKSLASLLLPVLVASCATGVNLNTLNTNVNKAQISSKLMSTVKDRIKIYSGQDAQKIFKITKPQTGFKTKANAFEPDYVIQHTSRTDAQCVKIMDLESSDTQNNQAIAIFNTQGDTYISGSAEAYAVIFNVSDGTIKYVIETSGMEFSDLAISRIENIVSIYMVGDDSSQDLDTAFISKFSYNFVDAPTLTINADSDLTNDDVFYLEGQNATSIINIKSGLRSYFGVTTGENGYFYLLNSNGFFTPGFSIASKIKDLSDSGDFRTATFDQNLEKIFILDGGWDQTSSSGSTNAKQDPKVIVLDSLTLDRSSATEFTLPFSSSTTGLGANYNFGTEKPGGQLSRTKIITLGESLVIAAGSGGLVSVMQDGTNPQDLTSLIPKGPIPQSSTSGLKMNAIVNDVYYNNSSRLAKASQLEVQKQIDIIPREGASINIGVISGYFGLTTLGLNPSTLTATKIMDYRLFENPSNSTNGTSSNSMNFLYNTDINGLTTEYLAIANGKRGASIYLSGNLQSGTNARVPGRSINNI
ncbi:MAG: hypothetical protein U0354_19645 [Candidatus Sericytochromatia bacterium]